MKIGEVIKLKRGRKLAAWRVDLAEMEHEFFKVIFISVQGVIPVQSHHGSIEHNKLSNGHSHRYNIE